MPHIRLLRVLRFAAAVAVLLLLAGCGAAGQRPATGGAAPGDGELVVFAAASLTESFRQVGKAFEAANPGVAVRFNFAGSSSLVEQVTRGAPADVLASANPQQMQRAVAAGEVAGAPATFARNRLQIAVPAGNPAGVTGLAAFGDPRLRIALCAEQVPCGAASLQALRLAGVSPRPDTLEGDVKAVLTKVRLGEVDAGLVYRTDVAAAGDAVEGVAVPAASQAVNEYRIGVLRGAPHPEVARAFVDFVRSDRGRPVLAGFGFDPVAP